MRRLPLKVLQFILGYSNLATVWAGIVVWEWIAKTKLSADTQWQLYAGGFIAISFSNWYKAMARAEAAERKPEKQKTPRVFAENPEALIEQLRDPKTLTDLQVVPYYDKWIAISGRVEFVACGPSFFAAGLILDRDRLRRGQRVNLRFDAGQESRLRDVRQGQYLTAVCQIRPSYSHSRAALENGEIVRVEPFPILARVS
jgi:hypothetical protein